MKVTIVCQGFESSSLNLQPWRRVYEISRRVSAESRLITIVTDGEPLSNNLEEKIGNVKIVRIANLMFAPFLKRKELISAILKTEPDLIVWYGTPVSIFYLNRLRALGKPLLLDLDTDFYSLKTLSRLPFREVRAQKFFYYFIVAAFSKWITRAIAKSSVINQIIVPNNHLSDKLSQKGVLKSKITIVPSTVEDREVKKCVESSHDFRARVDLDNKDFVVSFFGGPTPIRGADVALKSLKKVIRQDSNVKLLIFSRRRLDISSKEDEYNLSEENRLKKLIVKWKIGGNAKIISGFIDSLLLHQYLTVSDCIVLPFRLVPSEPPLSIFEAMKLGKAIITTHTGGLPEIIGTDRGLLVEPGNADELANAIISLTRNPEKLKTLGRKAKEYAQNLPNWSDVAEKFTQTLDYVNQMNIQRTNKLVEETQA